jgi:hypothetical protein
MFLFKSILILFQINCNSFRSVYNGTRKRLSNHEKNGKRHKEIRISHCEEQELNIFHSKRKDVPLSLYTSTRNL